MGMVTNITSSHKHFWLFSAVLSVHTSSTSATNTSIHTLGSSTTSVAALSARCPMRWLHRDRRVDTGRGVTHKDVQYGAGNTVKNLYIYGQKEEKAKQVNKGSEQSMVGVSRLTDTR